MQFHECHISSSPSLWSWKYSLSNFVRPSSTYFKRYLDSSATFIDRGSFFHSVYRLAIFPFYIFHNSPARKVHSITEVCHTLIHVIPWGFQIAFGKVMFLLLWTSEILSVGSRGDWWQWCLLDERKGNPFKFYSIYLRFFQKTSKILPTLNLLFNRVLMFWNPW